MRYEVINGECLAEMTRLIERGVSVDACITDPPYGTTACAWDAVIPFAPMWAALKSLVKRDGAIVLFGSQPFTSALVMSNPGMFRHEWIWEKNAGSNFANLDTNPMKEHESVIAFGSPSMTFNAQAERRAESGLARVQDVVTYNTRTEVYGASLHGERASLRPEMRVPRSVQKFNRERGLHPSQKPVELMRYLVRTYTNPGDTVLDFTAGSFSTGVACVIEGRNFIGIEQSEDYCRIGEARMKRASGEWAEIPRTRRNLIETPLFASAEG